MAQVVLNRVLKKFSNDSVAVNNVSLAVADKEFLVLVGPSGCGKSTTLRLIAGLELLTDGEIQIGDRVVNDVAPKDRDIAMVFQNYALYPHMSVYKNMAFGLQLRFGGGVFKRGLMRLVQPARSAELAALREGIDNRVRQAAQRLEIEHLLNRKPHELSGGERQRVALGRAIVREPAAFLFDEPLSNLDAKLRQQMRVELKRLHRELDATMIYVTHDQIEAMTLGDRVAVMNQGEIQQVAPPMEIYQKPANLFVARFIGSTPMNLVQGKWGEGSTSEKIQFESKWLRIELDANRFQFDTSRKNVTLGFRAEAVMVNSETESGDEQLIEATVVAVDQLGDSMVAYVQKNEASNELWVTRLAAESRVAVGQKLQFELSPDAIHLFDSESGKNLLKD